MASSKYGQHAKESSSHVEVGCNPSGQRMPWTGPSSVWWPQYWLHSPNPALTLEPRCLLPTLKLKCTSADRVWSCLQAGARQERALTKWNNKQSFTHTLTIASHSSSSVTEHKMGTYSMIFSDIHSCKQQLGLCDVTEPFHTETYPIGSW